MHGVPPAQQGASGSPQRPVVASILGGTIASVAIIPPSARDASIPPSARAAASIPEGGPPSIVAAPSPTGALRSVRASVRRASTAGSSMIAHAERESDSRTIP
jgi:hypothetical protein